MGISIKSHADRTVRISAITNWLGNEKKNGWKPPNLETSEGMDSMLEHGIDGAGLVNIPVCSLAEAYHNIYNEKKTDNFPCN